MYMLMTIHMHLHKIRQEQKKGKKTKKAISILKNALISDFILKSVSVSVRYCLSACLFVYCISFRVLSWCQCSHSTLYHAFNALSYLHLRKWLNDLRPCLWPFKDFCVCFCACLFVTCCGGFGEPVLTAVAWC